MSYQSKANGLLNDYMNVRTIPALISVVYVLASLYQFGGISDVTLVWLGGSGGYTLTGEHAIMFSLGAYALAFASSETKRFESYETWEQVGIALGPLTILGYEYVQEVTDFITNIGDPLGVQLAFVVTIVSWAVAVR